MATITLSTCPCGKRLAYEDGKLKPHRPNPTSAHGIEVDDKDEGGKPIKKYVPFRQLSRKKRKSMWCPIPERLQKAALAAEAAATKEAS